MAIVGDLYELESSVLDGYGDGGGAGVEAVLDELLHRRRRPLDHLPGRDAVHHRLLQPPDAGRVRAAPADARRRLIDVHARAWGTECKLLRKWGRRRVWSLDFARDVFKLEHNTSCVHFISGDSHFICNFSITNLRLVTKCYFMADNLVPILLFFFRAGT